MKKIGIAKSEKTCIRKLTRIVLKVGIYEALPLTFPFSFKTTT